MKPRMQLFADEWLTGANTGKQFHGAAAYAYAGYTVSEANPSANASKLLRHPKVKEYIEKRMDEHAMSATEVLLRFTAIARSEVGDVVTLNPAKTDLMIDPEAVIDNKQFIAEFGFDANGHPKIKFHDALAALRDIARVRGMLKDGLEISGTGGGPVVMQVQFIDMDGKSEHLEGAHEDDVDSEDFSEFDDAVHDFGPVQDADGVKA